MIEPDTEDRERGHGLTVPDLIKEVFVDYTEFARKYLVHSSPPLMYVVVWLIGMDAVAGSIELEYFYTGEYQVDNWFHAWVRIMGGGVPAGIIRYWLVGSVFHVLVLAAGGKGSARTSRYIFLYAVLPVAVCNLTFRILEMLIYGNEYFAAQKNTLLDGLFSIVLLAAYAYTVVLCYRGMRALQGTEKRRTLFVLASAAVGMTIVVLSLGG